MKSARPPGVTVGEPLGHADRPPGDSIAAMNGYIDQQTEFSDAAVAQGTLLLVVSVYAPKAFCPEYDHSKDVNAG